jgi:NADPH-dependent 2,4-dienoyl-CoA reductase/sulfur reductase-like enzyme
MALRDHRYAAWGCAWRCRAEVDGVLHSRTCQIVCEPNMQVHAMTRSFDVLVVGAGPVGIAAAVCAAEEGREVALVDENPRPGGQIWRSGTENA